MDDARVGRALWVLRRRRKLSQLQLARDAAISRSAVSLIERGHAAALTLRTVRAAFGAVDAGFEGHIRWRGADLDRVLDERHASLVAAFADRLRALRWEVTIEATFSEYGERGSIDLLGIHSATRTAVVVEVKTEIASVEEMLRRLDVKERLAPKLVSDRYGWRPAGTGTVLVVLEGSTARRRALRHRTVLAAALPSRGRDLRTWLRSPSGPVRGLLFLPSANSADRRRRTRRAGRA